MSELFGFLVIDKPVGKTSRDVVNIVQRLARPAKAGHAGTLDPLATGVLVICLGAATRLVSMVQEGRKCYRAEFQFGVTSPTDDLEGTVVDVLDAPRLTRAAIEAVLPKFVGTIQQVPPAHSAVHVAGRRAYELARRGEIPNLPPREVTISRIEIVDFIKATQTIICDVDCGSGTYIRSLGRDIAARLKTGCVMTSLRRLAVGPFSLDTAISTTTLSRDVLEQELIPAARAFDDFPERIELSAGQWEDIRHGRAITDARIHPPSEPDRLPLFYQDQLVAVARYDTDRCEIWPKMVFPYDCDAS